MRNEDLMFKIIGAIIALILLRFLWPVIIGILAICGVVYICRSWDRDNRNRRQ